MLPKISNNLYDVCHFVEQQIVGQENPILCDWWAKKNAFRHAFTLESILSQIETQQGRRLKILNMSGLSCGHQDFSILAYLAQHSIKVDYFAIEHPNSPYLRIPIFNTQVAKYGIETILCNLQDVTAATLREKVGAPDIVLFTEIAEHLEHADLLRSFRTIADILAKDGSLILTIPNLDSFDNRFQHLFGKEIDYWGDGLANLDQGLFGHIVYYNIPRLRRLLRDIGLEISTARTLNFPYPDPKLAGLRLMVEKTKLKTINAMISLGEKSWRFPRFMNSTKTLGELIYIEARRGRRERIPFAL